MGTDINPRHRGTHRKSIIMSHTNIPTISARPISVTGLTHYYQGRPNVMFLDRYNTRIDRRTVGHP